MANLKPGDERGGYTVEAELSQGLFARSYRARKDGRQVFLKQYISPKPSVDWFNDYVAYQNELKSRIQNSDLKDVTYEFIDFFEATRPPRHIPESNLFYQTFEWIEEGQDLSTVIKKLRNNPASFSGVQRHTWAKVIMGSIKRLHHRNIVHVDLKPENLILIPDKTIEIKYRLKLIDMDFSLLSDKRAPWHGIEGYVGTPGWFSPEHENGKVPTEKSDVFTCGLILYDLLDRGNPYQGLDPEEYKDRVLNFRAPPPNLEGTVPEDSAAIAADAIHRSLHPTQSERPTAEELHQALIGHGRIGAPPPSPPSPPSPHPADPEREPGTPEEIEREDEKPAPVIPDPKIQSAITLSAEGQSISLNITTKLSKYSVRHLGEDSQFWDNDWQMTIELRDDGWHADANPAATNETMLNGKAVSSPTKLSSGDELGVGRESKNIIKMPLTITIA